MAEKTMRWMLFAVMVPVLLSAVGCSDVRMEKIVPQTLNVAHHEPGTVAVAVGTGDVWVNGRGWVTATGISSNPVLIGQATEETIRRFKVFDDVKAKGSADYLLDIKFTYVGEPVGGADLNAGLGAHWTLTRVATQKVIWEKDVEGTGVAKFFEALAAVERARIAEERAIEAHIKSGLEALSKDALEK
jgi:hypothetical protein